MQLTEQEIIRREKLDRLRNLNINPYPADLYPVTHTSEGVKNNFEEGKKVFYSVIVMRINVVILGCLITKEYNYLVTPLSRID